MKTFQGSVTRSPSTLMNENSIVPASDVSKDTNLTIIAIKQFLNTSYTYRVNTEWGPPLNAAPQLVGALVIF